MPLIMVSVVLMPAEYSFQLSYPAQNYALYAKQRIRSELHQHSRLFSARTFIYTDLNMTLSSADSWSKNILYPSSSIPGISLAFRPSLFWPCCFWCGSMPLGLHLFLFAVLPREIMRELLLRSGSLSSLFN